jgi:hypothetical protein
MFVRFRITEQRLQASLVGTRRVDGKVQHEHIAALGSVRLPISPETRTNFWHQLWPRLARLDNTLDTDIKEKVCDALRERIPIVMPDELHALRVEAAKADEKWWSAIQARLEEQAADNLIHAQKAKAAADSATDGAENAAKHASAAKQWRGKLERGDGVARGIKRPDTERMLRKMGFTDADFRHWRVMKTIHDLGANENFIKAITDQTLRHRIARKILRDARRSQPG